MRHVTIRKKWERRNALLNLGINSDLSRVFVGEVTSQNQDAKILRLPIDIRFQRKLQDPDTGELYFMYGVHPYGGPNPFH
jgi:hypothetical protein